VTGSGWRAAKRTPYAGITWRSAAEAERARKLEFRRRAGEILAWEKAPRFDLVINGKKCGWYTPDFLVTRPDGTRYLLEVKGHAVREFTFRTNVFRALYPEWELLVIGEDGNPWKARPRKRRDPADLLSRFKARRGR
jgi:hypothetical protein